MDKMSLTYARCSEATPEAELSVLANVYKFVLERKEAAPRQSRPDAAKEIKNDSRHLKSTA